MLAVRYDNAVREGYEGELRLVDSQTGQELARLRTGRGVMALVRSTEKELLVSDVLLSPDGLSADARLLVFDVSDGLSLKRAIPLPGRVEYTTFAQRIVLSDDESHLFFHTLQIESPSTCQGDGKACAIWGIGVLDLKSPDSAVVNVPLPRLCGWSTISPGVESILVACRHGEVLQIAESGQLTSWGAALQGDPPKDPVGRLFTSSELAVAYQIDSERVLAISMNGNAVELNRAGKREDIGVLIPPGVEVSLGPVPSFDRTRVSIPFGERGNSPSGVVTILNQDLRAHVWPLTGGGGYLSNLPSGSVAVLQEHQLIIYDDNGTATTSFAADFSESGHWALVR